MKLLLRLPLFWLWCIHPTVRLRVFYRMVMTSMSLGPGNRFAVRMIANGYGMCGDLERAFLDWRFPEVRQLIAEAGLA